MTDPDFDHYGTLMPSWWPSGRQASVGLAITVGPLAGYLVWAVTGRHWWHASLAVASNAALWLAGPMWLLHALHGHG